MKRPVIFIVESGGLSGGVRVILEEAARLSQRGWKVSIYSIDRPPAWFVLPTEVEWRQFPDYRHLQTVLVTEDSWKIATWWKTAQVLKDALRGDEGLYLVQDIETSYYSPPIIQELVMDPYDHPLRKYTTSRWVEENLPDVEYVGIGIDFGLYKQLGLERNPKALMSVARAQRLKGLRQLGELSRRLGPGYELYTVGVMGVKLIGAWKRHYQGLADHEIVRMYNEVSCFISCTQHEGFNLCNLEAMAIGTPVVTTDADGNMQYCRDGENCLVVDPLDMRGMAHAVRRMLSDEKLREKCIANGLETAKKYPWEPVIDRLEALLRT